MPIALILELIPALIELMKQASASGIFDVNTPIDLSTLGSHHRQALMDLAAELAKEDVPPVSV